MLGEAGLDAVVAEAAGAGTTWEVRLPPAQIAAAARILAAFERPAPPQAPPSALGAFWSRHWKELFFVANVLAVGLAAALDRAKLPGTIGSFLAVLGAYHSTKKLADPNANRLGTYALLAVVSSFQVLGLLANDGKAGIASKVLFGGTGTLLTFVALALAVAGLVVGYRSPEARGVGRSHAWWAVVLSLPLLEGVAVGVWKATHRERPLALGQPAPGTPLVFEEMNFRLPAPARPWVSVDAKKLNADAIVGFTRHGPEVWVLVIAERLPEDFTSEALLEAWRARTLATGPDARIGEAKPVRLGGLAGFEVTAQRSVAGKDFHYVQWVVTSRGFGYQIIAWGLPKDAQDIRTYGYEIASSFELVEPARRSGLGPRQPAGAFSSDYGYSVDLGGAPWFLEGASDDLPAVEFGAVCGDGMSFLVMPYPLAPGDALAADELLRLVAAEYGLELQAPGVTAAPYSSGAYAGKEIVADISGDEERYVYRARAVAAKGATLLAVEARRQPSSVADGACGSPLDRLVLGTPRLPKVRTPAQRRAAATLLRSIGKDLIERGQPKPAFARLARAFEADPENADVAWELVDAGSRAGTLDAAARALDGRLAALGGAEASPLLLVRARIHALQGEPKPALALFARYFGAGGQDDDAFVAYAELLEKEGARGRALDELARYRQHRDTATVAVLESNLLQRRGDLAAATAVLERRVESADPGGELGLALVALYQEQDKFREAIDLCARLASQGRGSTELSLERARSEVSLHWYGAAKATLEAALKRAPEDARLQRSLAYVSSQLGEGANSAVKEPIPAVEPPASLLEAPAELAAEGANAVYLARVTAISFEAGKDYRTTEWLKARVETQAGVEAFSTLRFAFDPRLESIFVNVHRITDAQGNVVSTGSVSDYYLSDQASEEIGTSERTLYVPVPGLEPGHVVELAVTRRWLRPPPALPYVRELLASGLPAGSVSVFVRGDLASIRHRASDGVTSEPIDGGLCWRVVRPAPLRSETFTPPFETFVPAVWLGPASATWESEVADYLDELGPLLDPPSPDLGSLAMKLTAGAGTEDARVAALARHVQKQLTYKALEFGRGARIPREPAEVLRKRYGDCKDHALLLQKLLAAAGIDAKLALIRSFGPVRRDVPSLDQFDHMVVFVDGERKRFLDTTSKWLPAADEPLGLAGQEALLLQRGAARFVSVPPAARGSSVDVQRELSREGDVGLREALAAEPADRRAEALQRWLGGVRIRKLEVEALEEPEKPLRLRLAYATEAPIHEAGGGRIVSLPWPWERDRIELDASEARATPVAVRFPLSVRSATTLALAVGETAEPLEAAASAPNGLATWSLEAEHATGRLQLRFAFDRPPGSYGPTGFEALHRESAAALAALGRPVVLAKPAGLGDAR